MQLCSVLSKGRELIPASRFCRATSSRLSPHLSGTTVSGSEGFLQIADRVGPSGVSVSGVSNQEVLEHGYSDPFFRFFQEVVTDSDPDDV